jgi:hypothetical protein
LKKYCSILIFLLTVCFCIPTFAQERPKVSTADYDPYLYDTLLLDPSQLELLTKYDLATQKALSFKHKEDGFHTYHFINGLNCSQGIIKDKKKEGLWTSWYDSGQVANKTYFANGIREGKAEFWYKNGKLNATGQYKNYMKEGEWLYYNRDGTFKGKYIYSNGILIGQE